MTLVDLFRHLDGRIAKCIVTPLLAVLGLPDELLLWDLPVGLHQSGPLPLHRSRYTNVLPQEALVGAGQLPVSVAPLPAPLHP